MWRSHHSSLRRAWQERQSFARKRANREELDRFFAQCLAFLGSRTTREEHAYAALSDGIAAYAFEKFGVLAPDVLRHWGIDSPEDLEKSLHQFLKACGSCRRRRVADFAQSEALKALFRGDFWP